MRPDLRSAMALVVVFVLADTTVALAQSGDTIEPIASPGAEPAPTTNVAESTTPSTGGALWTLFVPSLSADYAFQRWVPRDIPDVYYRTTGLNLLRVRVGTVFENIAFLRRLAGGFEYEWAPGGRARQDELIELQRATEANISGWESFLGNVQIGLPFGGDRYRPDLFSTIERQYFLVSAQALKDYWYYTQGGVDLLVPGDTISTSTVMTRWRYGLSQSFGPATQPSVRWDLGGYALNYRKPYTHDLFTTVSRTAIFDSRFRSLGLFTELAAHGYWFGNAPTILTTSFSLGPAEIELDDISASELLPDDASMMMYEWTTAWDAPLVQADWFRLRLEIEYIQRRFGTFFSEGSPDDDSVNDGNLNTDHIVTLGAGLEFAPSFLFHRGGGP